MPCSLTAPCLLVCGPLGVDAIVLVLMLALIVDVSDSVLVLVLALVDMVIARFPFIMPLAPRRLACTSFVVRGKTFESLCIYKICVKTKLVVSTQFNTLSG